jgi:hypothetical protein
MNSVPVAAHLRIIIHELIKTPTTAHTHKKEEQKTYVHGAALKTDRLALLDARGTGTLDGGAMAGL